MLNTIVIALVRLGKSMVVGIVAGGCIAEAVAVVMAPHEGIHVSHIVVEVDRSGVLVVGREVAPVPG